MPPVTATNNRRLNSTLRKECRLSRLRKMVKTKVDFHAYRKTTTPTNGERLMNGDVGSRTLVDGVSKGAMHNIWRYICHDCRQTVYQFIPDDEKWKESNLHAAVGNHSPESPLEEIVYLNTKSVTYGFSL